MKISGKFWVGIGLAGIISGCATPLPPIHRPIYSPNLVQRPANPLRLQLPDKVEFLQTDRRWAHATLGGSHASLEDEGCLVTAAAMALVNLGFKTDPGDLTYRLKAYGGFNSHGWLVWRGLEKATANRVKTYFYQRKDNEVVRSCLAAGYYPLVKFNLPSSKTHWVLVVGEADSGFFIRDPMISSATPIPLASRTSRIDAVRCVGVRV
ncbi:MAG: hypothetical protein COA91_07580 [Robiginitomaculum sp.]|nr:MAG: hypothetical protein COA91_07580 [Robiginitomaculum sp.]